MRVPLSHIDDVVDTELKMDSDPNRRRRSRESCTPRSRESCTEAPLSFQGFSFFSVFSDLSRKRTPRREQWLLRRSFLSFSEAFSQTSRINSFLSPSLFTRSRRHRRKKGCRQENRNPQEELCNYRRVAHL